MNFIKSSAIYGGLSVLARASAVLTAPILTSLLSVSDYGVIDTLNSAIAIASLLIGMNLDSGVFRLYFEKKEEERSSLLTTTLILYLGASGVLTGLVLLVPSWSAGLVLGSRELGILVTLSILRFPALLAFQQASSLLRMLGRPYPFAFFNLLLTVANVAVVIGLYFLELLTLPYLIGGQSAIHLVVAFLLLLYVRPYYRGHFDRDCLREVLQYSLPQMPSLLMNFLVAGAMPVLITGISSTHETGLFSLAQKLAMPFTIIVFAFRTAYDPVMMRMMAEKSSEEFRFASKESLRFYLLLLVPLLGFVAAMPFLFTYLIDEKFAEALEVFPLLALSHYLLGLHNILGLGIAFRKRTKFLSYAQGWAALLFVTLVYPLVAGYGFRGAAGLVLLATSVQTTAIYLYSQRLFHVDHPVWAATGLLLLVTASTLCPLPIQLLVLVGMAVVGLVEWRRNRFLEVVPV